MTMSDLVHIIMLDWGGVLIDGYGDVCLRLYYYHW